jgi:hypothetical protein
MLFFFYIYRLPIEGVSNLNDAMKKGFENKFYSGENQYPCDEHGKQDCVKVFFLLYLFNFFF